MSSSNFVSFSFFIAILIVLSVWIWRRYLLKSCRALQENVQTLLLMSAKLACSARHISRFDDISIRRDLVGYSPFFALVGLRHDGNTTSASLLNCIEARAIFFPNRGALLKCADVQIPCKTDVMATQEKRRASVSAACLDQSLQALLLALINEDNRQGLDTRALLVMRGGRVLAAAYGADITPNTRLLGWSMAKSLLAMLWGRLETLGLGDIQQRRLFPEWEEDERSKITLKNLLQMCDGLAFDETYRAGTDATRMLFCGNGKTPAAYAPSRYALGRPLIHRPGMHFSYSSGTTNLLARWIHQRLGSSEATSRFLNREFLEPLGLNRTFIEMDSEGVFVGSSYAFASAEDWGKLAALMLNEGCANGRRLLSVEWVKRATEPNDSVNDPRYGYQFWLNSGGGLPMRYPDLPPDTYFMQGHREQKLMLSPSHGAAIVRLGWSSHPYPVTQRFGEILAQLHP